MSDASEKAFCDFISVYFGEEEPILSKVSFAKQVWLEAEEFFTRDKDTRIAELEAEVARLQERVDNTTCCETCEEWEDTTKEPPAWVVCWKCYNKLSERNNALRERVKALEEAMKPFAVYAEHLAEHPPHMGIGYYWSPNITVGDCRKAAELLAEPTKPKENS